MSTSTPDHTSGDSARDTQLLAEFARGQQRAFDVLVHRHGGDVKAYALRVLRSAEQAEEVYVEAFTKLAQLACKWKQRGTVRGFLFTAAHHQCMDILRKRRTVREANAQLVQMERTRTFQPSPEAVAQLGEFADELERALAELPEKHRHVLLLRTVHGLSAEETAQVTGLDPSQVHSRVSYARKELRKRLQQPRQNHNRRHRP